MNFLEIKKKTVFGCYNLATIFLLLLIKEPLSRNVAVRKKIIMVL